MLLRGCNFSGGRGRKCDPPDGGGEKAAPESDGRRRENLRIGDGVRENACEAFRRRTRGRKTRLEFKEPPERARKDTLTPYRGNAVIKAPICSLRPSRIPSIWRLIFVKFRNFFFCIEIAGSKD